MNVASRLIQALRDAESEGIFDPQAELMHVDPRLASGDYEQVAADDEVADEAEGLRFKTIRGDSWEVCVCAIDADAERS